MEDIQKYKRRRFANRDLLIITIIIILSLSAMLGYGFFKQELTREIITYGLIGTLIITFLLDFIPQFLSPHLVILIAISSRLNVNLVVIASIIGTIIGSIVGYEIGSKQGFELICYYFKKKTILKTLNFWEKYGKIFVFISALAPLPYFPLVFGALKMPKKDFFHYGLIPRIIGFIAIGYGYYFGIVQFFI